MSKARLGLPRGYRVRLLDRSILTGSPRTVMVERAPRSEVDPTQAALEHVSALAGVLSRRASLPGQYAPDLLVPQSRAGSQTVHLQQVLQGVPILGMARAVRFQAGRRLHSIVGDTYPVDTAPRLDRLLDPLDALRGSLGAFLGSPKSEPVDPPCRKAFENLADGGSRPLSVTHALGMSVLNADRSAFASLTLALHPRPKRLEPVWQVRVGDIQGSEHWAFLVQARGPKRGRLLNVHDHSMGACRAWVHRWHPDDGSLALVDLPHGGIDYPQTLHTPKQGFPRDWVAGADTLGACVEAVLYDVEDDHSALVAGTKIDTTTTFDGRQDLRTQAAVNLVYYCSWLHDFFELLGFDAAAGNYERFSPTAGDPLIARVRDRPNLRRAWLVPAPDGRSSVLNTGPDPDTGLLNGLEADTVFHEYTHAVTQRLVGGPSKIDVLGKPQSRGLAEGWSDYFALTVQNERRHPAPEQVDLGRWSWGRSARSHPYDADYPKHAHYGSIGKPGFREAHEIGEIWAATLLEIQRRMVAELGSVRGNAIAWQSVFDSLAPLPDQPTFIEARDSMLTALGGLNGRGITQNEFDRAHRIYRDVFALYGLGVGARTEGPELRGIVADFNTG